MGVAMKLHESELRLKRFEADEKAQKVIAIEQMITDFAQLANELSRQVAAEEETTGIRDKNHFAYSTFARSAAQRRDNLLASINSLENHLQIAIEDRDAIFDELGQFDRVLKRDQERLQFPIKQVEPHAAS